MVAIAVWGAIISLVGLVVSAALYGHRQHKDPRWAALDAEFEAQLLGLAAAAKTRPGERRRLLAKSAGARRPLPGNVATRLPVETRRPGRLSISSRRFAQPPSRRTGRSRA